MVATWSANGLSVDLPKGGVMQGQWQGADLAVWRSMSGRISAWADRCPHRGMRLSHGFVRGETLSCIYHGWVYGASGACQHIPAHPAMVPPASIKTESFEAREQDGVIWIAAAPQSSAPPRIDGYVALRSMVVAAPVAAVQGALPGRVSDPQVWKVAPVVGGHALDLCLIVQERAAGTAVHGLIRDTGSLSLADKAAASGWMEHLRRAAEQERAA